MTAVMVQARMGSSRLPGKSLRVMCGYPMIRHVLTRAMAVTGVKDVWLVTSVNERDDQLSQVAAELGFPVYRGSEWDVLQRMSEAVRIARATTVVRITGDCPLLAPDVSAAVLDIHGSGKYDYTGNDTTMSGWPDGLDTEVFPAELLHDAASRATERADREHVTRWMRRHVSPERQATYMHGDSTSNVALGWHRVKLSVDSPEDFSRVASVMSCATGMHWADTRAAFLRWQEMECGRQGIGIQ